MTTPPPPPSALSFAQGSAQHLAFRERALTDLYWFVSVVLGHANHVPIHEHSHRLLCRFVESRTGCEPLDGARIKKLELPRDWGKSTVVTQGYVIQQLCADPNISVLIANEKEQTAKDFLHAIKQQFERNDLLRALFPEVIPVDLNDTTWSASRIIVNRTSHRREPSVFVIGVGGTVTGMHPNLIIVDDMISREAMENARAGSWQIMHQTNRWINQLWPLLDKNHPRWGLFFVGTRWWHGDSYEHVDEAYGYKETPVTYNLRMPLPDGTTQIVPAHRFGDIAVFRRRAIEHGRSAFPEKWSLEDLAKMRLRDPALFACNMMNEPSDDVTATFKAEWLRYYEWIDDRRVMYVDGAGAKRMTQVSDLDVVLLVDPGGFATRQVEDRARAAIVALADTGHGTYLVLDVSSERDTFVACIDTLCSWVTRYTPRKVAIERVGQQGAFIELVRRAFKERGYDTLIQEVKPGTAQKEVRILGLESYFQRGQLLVGKGPNFHEFHEQYRQFPRARRVDVLDALAYFPEVVRRPSGASGARSNAARREHELAAYRARRGRV